MANASSSFYIPGNRPQRDEACQDQAAGQCLKLSYLFVCSIAGAQCFGISHTATPTPQISSIEQKVELFLKNTGKC